MLEKLKSKASLTWLFYAGLLLVLLSGRPPASTELTPDFFRTVRKGLGLLGYALLCLRLLTLLPLKPLYTLACCGLLFFSRISAFIAAPITLNLVKVALIATAAYGSDLRVSLKIYLGYSLFFLIVLPVLYALGFAGNITTHVGSLVGSSFGFGNPNQLTICIALTVFIGLKLAEGKKILAGHAV